LNTVTIGWDGAPARSIRGAGALEAPPNRRVPFQLPFDGATSVELAPYRADGETNETNGDGGCPGVSGLARGASGEVQLAEAGPEAVHRTVEPAAGP
jgi:hypothetical protein